MLKELQIFYSVIYSFCYINIPVYMYLLLYDYSSDLIHVNVDTVLRDSLSYVTFFTESLGKSHMTVLTVLILNCASYGFFNFYS